MSKLQKRRQVQTVRHSSVRQLVLSCVKAWETLRAGSVAIQVLAMQHFDTVPET